MSGVRQGWLVAVREMRERSRSRAFRASVVVMVLVVAAVIILPSMLGGSGTKDVGLTGKIPSELRGAIQSQAMPSAPRPASVVYARWPPANKPSAAATSTSSSSMLGGWSGNAAPTSSCAPSSPAPSSWSRLRDRAAAAGIKPEQLLDLVAPVPVESVELGRVAGRSADDETAALIMNVLLLMVISTFGGLVLTGVVEEKASRVVEVLLARIPARTLLAGKVTGIGLLGLAQVAVTALAALIATATVDSFDVPAARGAVIAWVDRVVRARLRAVRHGLRRARLPRLADRGRPKRRRARDGRPDRRLLRFVRGHRKPRHPAGPSSSRSSRPPRHSRCPVASQWERPRGGNPSAPPPSPLSRSPVSSSSVAVCTPARSFTPGRH